MKQYFVSVIIPTYQRTDLLQDAISSVLAQHYEPLELIVVDDNAKESDFRKETERFMKRYTNDMRVCYIQHEQNLGGCAARNTGIRAAKGDMIAFLDDDDRWKDDYLEKMLSKFDNEKTGMVYCHGDVQAGDVIYTGKRDKWKRGFVYEDIIGGWCPDSTSLVMIKKQCFEQVGMFDTNLKSFQDYDMWLRIAKQFEVDFVPENLIIKMENHGEQISVNPYKRLAGMKYLKEKWQPEFNIEQQQKFSDFLHLEEQQVRKNFIIYNRKKHIQCNYFKLYLEYCKTSAKMINKIGIILVIVFGYNIVILFNKFRKGTFTRG